MREFEITSRPELDEKEQRTTDLHSLINILNIIVLQISELQEDFPSHANRLAKLEFQLRDLANAFRDEGELLPLVDSLRKTEAPLIGLIESILESCDVEEVSERFFAAKENFESIYQILNVRLDELSSRLGDPDVWVRIKASDLRQQIYDVFSAIEKNAHGRYYIRYNLALKNKQDYYIDLKIETTDPDGELCMPLRLKDVLRDLLANSRKYTVPGGKVALGIHQNEKRILCVVEDSGCGIPEGELEKVSGFGYRATNVRERRTMGGGFGLTKAVWLVLGWKGRFWISSEVSSGTCIRLEIPTP